MNFYKIIFVCVFFTNSLISAGEFTVSSYNCGGLSDHYDYLRAAGMQKLMQERYMAEPENMALNEKIQKLALKILFSPESSDKSSAENEWNQKGYQHLFEHLTATPTEANSPNTSWHQKVDQVITSYKIRPVVIRDEEVNQMLKDHLSDLTKGKEAELPELLQEARALMAKRIFAHHLKYDIICLQEADYLDTSMFPEHYEVAFGESSHSINGVAWNKERFDLVEVVGSVMDRGFVVKLLNKESGKTVLVASGHISGCNPYRIENDPATGLSDSSKGDTELKAIVELFDQGEADFLVIGMDSNVTSLHPRLNILKDASYQLDYENYLDPTCANPHQVLNTRIDWIAVKPGQSPVASIINIPVLGVDLNNIQTNISDHKPIAAKITY